MAQIIDALYVSLGLDTKGFKEGSKQASKSFKDTGAEAARTAKDMEARGAQAAQFFSKLRNEALGLLAIFTAGVGIKSFVESTVNSASNLGRLSDNLGISTEKLSAYGRASEIAGGSAESMVAQLKASSGAVSAFKNGMMTDGTAKSFMFGLNENDLKNGEAYLLGQARVIHNAFKKDPADAKFKADQMGLSEESFNLLKKGPEAVLALVAAQQKHSKISREDADKLDQLRVKFIDFKATIEGVSQRILITLQPVFEKMLVKFGEWATWLEAHQDDIKAWVEKAIDSVVKFAKELDKAAESVGGWKNVLIALVALQFAPFIASAVSLAASLMSVGTALGVIGVSGAAALAMLAKLGIVGTLLMHSEGLNKDEDKELERRKNGGSSGRSASGSVTDGTKPSPTAGATAEMFRNLEAKNNLPFGTLDSMWQQESGRGKNMLSPKGAKGHFQFMDATAKQYGVTDPNDLAQSADGAARMMGELMRQSGESFPMALAKYNFGQGNLARTGMGKLPIETQNYLSQVQGRMGNGGRGSQGVSTSETVINGGVQIVTQATDAKEMARDAEKQIKTIMFTAQANTGLQ